MVSVEEALMLSVEDVLADLRVEAKKLGKDEHTTLEEKAISLAEINTAILLLSKIKAPSSRTSKRSEISTYFFNQQLIHLAKKSIEENESLSVIYKDMTDMARDNYYVGEALDTAVV